MGRQLAIIDKNRDLFITPVNKTNPKKIGTMIDSFLWNDENDYLAAIADGKFVVWYYPMVTFIDQDIVSYTMFEREGE